MPEKKKEELYQGRSQGFEGGGRPMITFDTLPRPHDCVLNRALSNHGGLPQGNRWISRGNCALLAASVKHNLCFVDDLK